MDQPDGLIQRLAGGGADGAARREAHVRNEDVCAGAGHLLALLHVEDVGRGQQVQRASLPDHVDFQVVSHARLLEIGPELPVDEADGGEVLHAGKAQVAQLLEKGGNVAEGICAADAGDDWCVLDDGEDFICLCR